MEETSGNDRGTSVCGPRIRKSAPSGNDQGTISVVCGKRTRKSTPRKRTADAWKYFDLSNAPDGMFIVTCKICGHTYTSQINPSLNGTTNMNRHLLKHNLREESHPYPHSLPLPHPLPHPYPHPYAPLDQGMYREKLCAAIIKHNYPFRYVEHEGTRELLSFLHPEVKHITRNTLNEDMLKTYRREKEKVKHELEVVTSRMCLTCDIWSSPSTDGYMTLTAHYVDENWTLKKRILNFRHVPPPHSGSMIASKLINFLGDWGIEKKIFSITLDNATYNDGVVNVLKGHLLSKDALVCKGEFIHVRCVAHILNLIVQEGLKGIGVCIHKIRECVKYVRWEERKLAFAELISKFSCAGGKKVSQDVMTRWNSTYLMLESALQHRRAFSQMTLVDVNFKTCPTEEEWNEAEKVARFLKPFYDITTLFSGCKYPTANLYFLNAWKIQLLIKEEMASNDLLLSDMAKDMMRKFEKYWEKYSVVLSFAIILDPRYKLKMMEYCYTKLGYSREKVDKLVANVCDKLHRLFKEYKHISSPSTHCSLASAMDVGLDGDDLADFDSYQSQHHVPNTTKSQLDLYLEDSPLDRKLHAGLDILSYWKGNRFRLPELSMMARDILSVPITSVASESSFSIGGQIFGKYCNSLLSSNAEMLLCTQDWLYADIFDANGEDEELLVEEFGKLERGSETSSNINE